MSPRPISITTISVVRRQSVQGSSSSVPSGPVIIGIAVAGAVVFCGCLTAIGLYIARTVHRRKKARPRQAEVEQDVGKDMRRVLEMRQSEAWPPQQESFGSVGPRHKRQAAINWEGADSLAAPATPKTARIIRRRSLSPQKPVLISSSTRDSWPLVSHTQMPPYVGQLPLGGLVEIQPAAESTPNGAASYPLKWPTRTYSRASRQNLVFDTNGSPESQSFSRVVETRAPRGQLKRRSTSESQLSSILRSTSQRLKRNSLTRARSSLGRLPGSPPKDRLPSPPRPVERSVEGREKSITPDPSSYAGSIDSSIFERYINRTPSPGRMVARSAGRPPTRRDKSPAPSAASDDTLCGGKKTPDLVIPAPLTSPSKRGNRRAQRHTVRLSSGLASSGGSSDISALMHRDGRSSVSALGIRGSTIPGSGQSTIPGDHNSANLTLNTSISISPHGDPFYSSVRSSTPPILEGLLAPGPRPLYIRKSTFGGEATPSRPSSYASIRSHNSPLRDISGNQQTPPRKSRNSTIAARNQGHGQSNPFQWSPQEARAHKISKTSGSRRKAKGHKRSYTIRMSALPRHPDVDMVPEASEEESTELRPKALNISAQQNSSCSPAQESEISRSPSVADFNPSLEAAQFTPKGDGASPLRAKEKQDPTECSSALSTNYYCEGPSSEDEFFKNALKVEASSRHERRNFSLHHFDALQGLTSFPSPSFTDLNIPVIAPPSIQLSTIDPPSFSISPPASPAPYLSTPQTNRVHAPHGPRQEPIPRTGITMETQICMLRRMNSEVSTFSSMAGLSPGSDNSPTLPDWRHLSTSPSKQLGKERRGRANKHYLNLGVRSSPSKRRAGMSTRDSMMKGRAREKVEPEKEERENERDEYETVYDPTDFFSGGPLTPIRVLKEKARSPSLPVTVEKVTPPKGLNIQSLKYPILSPTGQSTIVKASPPATFDPSPDRTPTQKHVRNPGLSYRNQYLNADPSPSPAPRRNRASTMNEKRWSDAMVKPPLCGLRSQRGSMMEMPKPRTPPKWAELGIPHGDVGDSQDRLSGQENQRRGPEKDDMKGGRRESLGLYDQAGFLRSSPDRTRID